MMDFDAYPLWDDLSDEQKQNLYESYKGELRYEWGDYKTPMTFEEFDEYNKGYRMGI